jgi:hypothetical protein
VYSSRGWSYSRPATRRGARPGRRFRFGRATAARWAAPATVGLVLGLASMAHLTLPDPAPPELTLPELALPELTLPEVTLPEVRLPELSLPHIAPQAPAVDPLASPPPPLAGERPSDAIGSVEPLRIEAAAEAPSASPTDRPTEVPPAGVEVAVAPSSATPSPSPLAPELRAILPDVGPLLPQRRIVAYYGNPLTGAMGVLGEQPLAEIAQRLRRQAQAYAEADPSRPVQAALEVITPVAQDKAGLDGLFRLRMPTDVIDEVAEVAEHEHLLLILDVQIGYSNVADELQALLPYLRQPYVHLALDPEFAMTDRRGKPGEIIGTLDAAEVNLAIRVLGDVVTAERLPPKVLIVHRFLEGMLTNYGAVHPTPSVQVVVDMDGFGAPHVKADKYQTYVRDQAIQYGGVKLFYKHDAPLWSPAEVLRLDPAPDVVIYQ